ncbi:MAG TPA: hypothetical protein VE869_08830 [Gemmatimonas sp.]|nr:hypothetical protein [Gemmatimonas sp.]
MRRPPLIDRCRLLSGGAWAAVSLMVAACVGRLPGVALSSRVPVPPPVFSTSDTTAMFAPGVISTGDVFASSFTPDGRTVFFTKATSDRTRMHIQQSTWTGSSWSTPSRASFSTGDREMDPHVSPDGKTVYFTAPRRRAAIATDADGDWDTWSAKLDGSEPAARITSLANSADNEMYPSITNDEALFFGVRSRANPDVPGEIRYLHRKIRTTPVVVPMGPEVVNPGNPYITYDGRVLIVSASGPESRGRSDLFVLVRRGDGRWSAPRNLGREVNTTDVEFCPGLSPDGRYLFFSRVRYDENNRAAGNDIFVTPVSSVPVLRDALGQKP